MAMSAEIAQQQRAAKAAQDQQLAAQLAPQRDAMVAFLSQNPETAALATQLKNAPLITQVGTGPNADVRSNREVLGADRLLTQANKIYQYSGGNPANISSAYQKMNQEAVASQGKGGLGGAFGSMMGSLGTGAIPLALMAGAGALGYLGGGAAAGAGAGATGGLASTVAADPIAAMMGAGTGVSDAAALSAAMGAPGATAGLAGNLAGAAAGYGDIAGVAGGAAGAAGGGASTLSQIAQGIPQTPPTSIPGTSGGGGPAVSGGTQTPQNILSTVGQNLMTPAGQQAIGGLLGSITGILGPSPGQQATGAQNMVDPFAPYRTMYAQQLNQLMQNPASVQQLPGYQAQLNQGLQAVQRQAAARGQAVSGQELMGLQDYASAQQNQYFQQQLQNLAMLSGANVSPAQGGAIGVQAGQVGAKQQMQNLAGIVTGVGSLITPIQQQQVAPGMQAPAAVGGNAPATGYTTPVDPFAGTGYAA